MSIMTAGLTAKAEAIDGISWNIMGQTYIPKARTESSMAWHATFPHGTFVPHHIHTTQDEFIYVLSGELELELNGGPAQKGKPGDLVRMPRGIPHGIFNRSGTEATCLFWVSPIARLWELFVALDGLLDPAEVVRLSALHEVDFLPPPE